MTYIKPLYIDSSTLARVILKQKTQPDILERLRKHLSGHTQLISSQVIVLEMRRTYMREKTRSKEIPWDRFQGWLDHIAVFNLNPQDWTTAQSIPFHIKSLDALHIAACMNSASILLSYDEQVNYVAAQMGTQVAD